MRVRLVLLLVAVWALPRPAPAAAPSRAAELLVEPLTLSRCMTLLESDAPTRALQQARVDTAAGLLRQATTAPNPVASYTAQDIGLQAPAGPALLHQSALLHQPMLSWPLLYFYTLPAQAAVGRAQLARTAAEVADERLRLRVLVGLSFHSLRLQERLVAIEDQAVAAADELVNLTAQRQRAGDVGGLDLLRARAEALEARRVQERAARQRTLQALAFSVLLGAERPVAPRLAAAGEDAPAVEPVREHDAAQLAQRPDLQGAAAALRQAQAQATLEARRALPLAALVGSAGARISAAGVGVVVALSVPLPLLDQNQGARRVAAAQAAAARANLEQRTRQAALEVGAERTSLAAARGAQEELVLPLLKLRQAALEATRRQFALGATGFIDVVAALRDELAAQRALAEAEQQAAAAAFRLRCALGPASCP